MCAVADGRTVPLLQQWTEPDGIQSFSVPRTCSWGQEVLDLDSLDSSRLLSTGDRDYTSLTLSKRKKVNLLSRFSSCAAFAKRRSDSSGIRLNWHSLLRLGLKWWTIRWSDSEGHFGAKVSWSVSRSVGRWGHSGGRSQAQADLALLGQPVDDLRLKVGVVDARLPEGPCVAVLLPVVVPVALLVGAVAEHRHLDTDSGLRRRPPTSYQGGRIP